MSVFVTNHTGYSYDKAKAFGELVYLTRGFIDFDDFDIKPIQSLIESATPDDYLLLSGNTLLCVIAVNLWITKHNMCKILHYRDGKFIVYELQGRNNHPEENRSTDK